MPFKKRFTRCDSSHNDWAASPLLCKGYSPSDSGMRQNSLHSVPPKTPRARVWTRFSVRETRLASKRSAISLSSSDRSLLIHAGANRMNSRSKIRRCETEALRPIVVLRLAMLAWSLQPLSAKKSMSVSVSASSFLWSSLMTGGLVMRADATSETGVFAAVLNRST